MFYLLLVGILFSFVCFPLQCAFFSHFILYYNIVILYLFFFLLIISVLRPLHTESEVFACKKINTTFRCVNHACAPPPKNWIWFVFFFFFCIRSMHFDRQRWRIRKNGKPHSNILDSMCNDLFDLHLSDAFIQSDLQLHSGYTFLLLSVFPGNRTHNLLRCWRNALPLSHTGTVLVLHLKLHEYYKCYFDK